MPCSACANARRRTKPYTPLSAKSDTKAKADAGRAKAIDTAKKEQERRAAARKEQERQAAARNEQERREKFAQEQAARQYQRNRAIAWQRSMAMARQRAIVAGARCRGRRCTANKRNFQRMNLTRR